MQNTITKQPKLLFRDLWGLIWLVILAIVLVGLVVGLLIWSDSLGLGRRPAQQGSIENISQIAFTDETGVRVVRVAVSGGGGLLDLRYQVIDSDKAVIVHDKENPLTIIEEPTGQAASTPWMDHSSRRELHAGVTYNHLIFNPGGVIKPGSTVSVVIGGVRLEHVTVAQ